MSFRIRNGEQPCQCTSLPPHTTASPETERIKPRYTSLKLAARENGGPRAPGRSEYTATLAHYLMLNAAIGNSYAVTASFPSGKFLQRSVTLYDTETTLLLAFE